MPQIIKIKVIPRSSENKIIQEKNNFLKVKLTSAPIKGEANKELIKILAKHLKTAKSDIEIIKGKNSKEKTVEIN